MLSEHQIKDVRCGLCGAWALYDPDKGRIISDWDTSRCESPCGPEDHIPEEFMPHDPELEEIDRLIDSINNLSKKARGMTATLTGFMGE